MSILLVAKKRNLIPLKEALLQEDENLVVEIWPDVNKPERVQFAVAWNQPENLFKSYPNLKVISSPGTGIEHLLNDSSIPDRITFTKVFAPSMVTRINEYIHTCTQSIQLQLDHNHQLNVNRWESQSRSSQQNLNMGILGLGNIGKITALYFSDHGYQVYGLSLSKKNIPGIYTSTTDQTGKFLGNTNILVNLLPLTEQTEGILNLELFKQLKRPSFLINVAHREHLVDEDLIYALDAEIIEYAYLNVLTDEALPESHPFWNRKKIRIEPQIAGTNEYNIVAPIIVENYKRLLSGMDLLQKIDRESG